MRCNKSFSAVCLLCGVTLMTLVVLNNSIVMAAEHRTAAASETTTASETGAIFTGSAPDTASTGTASTGTASSGFRDAQRANPADIQAWDKLRWGMKPQEVSAAIGQMILKVDAPGRFTHQIDGSYKGYKLAFTFFGNRGLERVALIDTNTPGLNERINQLEELLVLKYGAPFREVTRSNVRTMEWLTDTKLVQVYYRDSPRNAMLNLIYTWRKSAMTEEY